MLEFLTKDPIELPPQEEIRRMFSDLAPRYDLFNHLSTFGLASIWRRRTLDPLKREMRVLDLGCGTGDLALLAWERLDGTGEVVGLDFSPQMLEFADIRFHKRYSNAPKKVRWVLRRAEDLPMEEKPFDLVVSGFVLRNIYENIDGILKGVHRSLRPGGQISFLDMTEPGIGVVRSAWLFYMNSIVAFYGKVLFGAAYPIFYLTDSAKRFLKPEEFIRKLEEAGFRSIRTTSFLFGIITLYRAVRP